MRFSLGTARQWHWISAAVSMAGMLLFAITGITLNHASQIPGATTVKTIEAELPVTLLVDFEQLPQTETRLPPRIIDWLYRMHDIEVPSQVTGSFDGVEYYIAWPGPGVDRWLSIDSEFGELVFESTDRGPIAYLNDLHKGRDTGLVWVGLIDVMAVAIIVFTLSGLWLLVKQASYKQTTWPLTALGVLLPVVIALVFIH